MRVLIFAYACDPGRQSEMGLGWNVSCEIARRHDVTLVTRTKNKVVFEKYLSEHPKCPHRKTKFLYHDVGGVAAFLKKKIPFGDQLYFSAWLKSATEKYLINGHREHGGYDVVHQLTFSPFFVKPWGARYSDKYVWGPIGGGGGTDARFPQGFPVVGASFRCMEWLYKVISRAVYSPFAFQFKQLRRRCAAIIFKAKAFSKDFPIAEEQVTAVTQETGYDGSIASREYIVTKHPLKIVAVGRMIPHKGFEYAIKGFNQFVANGGEGELHLFGDGPLRKRLEGLGGKLIFHGNVPNAEVHKMLGCADVFLHGSFIEAAAWSILEAMIHGVPVVCQDRSGMADMVTAETGAKVKAEDPNELINGFAQALMKYYANPGLIAVHGKGAQERVRTHYAWNKCGDLIDEVYRKVMAK